MECQYCFTLELEKKSMCNIGVFDKMDYHLFLYPSSVCKNSGYLFF